MSMVIWQINRTLGSISELNLKSHNVKIMNESILFFSRVSLWKLSTFRGYKGYLYWSENRIQRVRFFKIELVGDLASRLD